MKKISVVCDISVALKIIFIFLLIYKSFFCSIINILNPHQTNISLPNSLNTFEIIFRRIFVLTIYVVVDFVHSLLYIYVYK